MLKNLRFAQVTCYNPMGNFHPVWRNPRRGVPSDWTVYSEESLASFHHADYQLEGVTQLTCLLHTLSVAGSKVNLRSLKFSTDGPTFGFKTKLKMPRKQILVKNSLALAFINLRELDIYVICSTTNWYNLLATEVALLRRCDGCCSTSVSDGISMVSTCIITL